MADDAYDYTYVHWRCGGEVSASIERTDRLPGAYYEPHDGEYYRARYYCERCSREVGEGDVVEEA